tara:strand:- start:179 stop:403 length:225 start_codon:yes stop_codon:yes gene_type:complete
MCLGGGGGYQPPKQVPAAPPVAGGPAPDDMVNDQVIDNVNPRDEMEGNQNAMDPSSVQKKTKLKVQSDKNTGLY